MAVNPKYIDEIVVLETNIDDSTAEELGFCLEKLMDAGAKDASFAPIFMKKCRPAYKLTVLCKPDVEEELIKIIFKHTSAVGLRREIKSRVIMDREKTKVMTEYGEVLANKFSYEDFSKVSLEYESAKKLADEKNVSINHIYRNYKICE